MSSSDEFNDPFSEDTGGGLLEMEGGRNIQAAKVAKGRSDEELWVICDWLLGRMKKPPLLISVSAHLPFNNPTHADIVAEALEGGFIKPQ